MSVFFITEIILSILLLFARKSLSQNEYGYLPRSPYKTGSPPYVPVDTSSVGWTILVPPDGEKFTPRNEHAACVFRDRLYVSGGKTQSYPKWNLVNSFKANDLWSSLDGGRQVYRI